MASMAPLSRARGAGATGSPAPAGRIATAWRWPSDVCSLQDFRLARCCSLSVGGAAPRAALDSVFFFLLNAPAALAAAAAWRWPRPRQNRERTDSAGERGPRWPQWRLSRAREAPELPGRRRRPAGSRQHGDGLRTCARSKISGWRVAAPYPLAGRRRAPRWILFFFLLNAPAALAAAAAWRWPRPRQNRERTDSAGERGPRWPQWRLSRAREAPELPGRRRRPAGSRQHGDGLRTCARSKISGWRVAAPYPLAGRRRAPRWILFFLFAECAGGAGRSRRMAMASPSAKSRAH